MTAEYALAQLRHAYYQLHMGGVVNQREFARGLLGPAIEALEVEVMRRPHEAEVLRRFEEWFNKPYTQPGKKDIRLTLAQLRADVLKERGVSEPGRDPASGRGGE